MTFISAQLQGGLGNQMFQIAICYSLAKRFNLIPIFSPKVLTGYVHRSSYWDTIFKSCKTDINIVSQIHQVINEEQPFITFDEISKNTLLNGYFQTSKYFSDIRNELLLLFSIPEQTENKLNTFLNSTNPENKNNICIHVRRGDYIKPGHSLPLNYYEKAYSSIHEDEKRNSIIYIISDDIQWCKENMLTIFKSNDSNNKVVVVENTDEIFDFFMLTKANILIGSNSTFSWWASYLNQKENKKSIFPKKWFPNNHGQHNPYLYENEWNLIEYDY